LPIIEDFREPRPNWNIGVMEYWNDGLRGEKKKRSMPFDFNTQYSTFPIFHHSIWAPHFSSRLSPWTMVFLSTKTGNFILRLTIPIFANSLPKC
jgi:hypothetical protein